jgi:flavin reductase (DIM6/NTAB) family NADH-FMN oxidoreductase RutF
VIVVGRVENVECQECNAPLVYFRGRYHKITSGTLDTNGEVYALFSGW